MISNEHATAIRYLLAFTAFSSFLTSLRLLRHHENQVDSSYLQRVLLGGLFSFFTTPIRLPFELYEKIRFGKMVDNLELSKPPIFIVGHWRSGTTYLHNLMCQDRKWGYVSLFQTMANDWCLVGNKTIKPMLARLMPQTRPMDNVTFALDNPEEEEHSIVRKLPYSFYRQWGFPRKGRFYFEKYALFQDVPDSVIQEWQKTYLAILRKATLNMGGRRLVLKNPVNTARIKYLLEIFPEAKFIHIYRNPYIVFLSTRSLYNKTLAITQLQDINPEEIEANILLFYQKMMEEFFKNQHLIPAKNLVEVRFEDLEANPLAELGRIYEQLDLPGFSTAEESFRTYIASQAGYQKNRYKISEEVIKKVNSHWQFALNKWGYEMLAA